jgi:sulfite exporter TauE/SafE
MIQIIIGSLLLSIVHASIPNHWIPLVAIGKAGNWSRSETLWVTAITGCAHVMSTILVGIIVGFIGYKFSTAYEFVPKVVAPLILIIMGLTSITIDLIKHHHHHEFLNTNSIYNKSKLVIITSLGIAMFFSPCIEIEAYYFTAGTYGWLGIAIVSIVYFIVTVSGMLLLVNLGRKGVEKIKWHFLEHHDKKIIGVVLIILGIFSYFIKI